MEGEFEITEESRLNHRKFGDEVILGTNPALMDLHQKYVDGDQEVRAMVREALRLSCLKDGADPLAYEKDGHVPAQDS